MGAEITEGFAKSRLKSLLDHLGRIDDIREPWRVAYPLREVLFLVVCGTICDCEDYDTISDWGEQHLDFLRRFLPFDHGVSGGRWLTILMNRIDPLLFSDALERRARMLHRKVLLSGFSWFDGSGGALMPHAYSLDLRQRVTKAITQGKSCREAAAQFEVSAATAVRFQQRLKQTGSLGPHREAWLVAREGVCVDPANLSKLLCKAGFTYKKALMATARERADIRQERNEWQRHRQPAIQAEPARLVFVDETSVKTNMTPIRGRSQKGTRLVADAPAGKWNTQTFIAGLRCHELVALFVINGAIDGDAWDCQDFRVWAGIMGKKASHYVATQGAGDPG